MEVACRGCSEAGGTTVGILPGDRASDANSFVEVALPTGMGEARNALVAKAGLGMIAVGGEYGTLSEVALALKIGKPVVAIGKWTKIEGVAHAKSAEDAVEQLARVLTP